MAEAKKTTVKEEKLSLDERLVAKRTELIEAKRGLAAGELQNPRTIGKIRKDIARILTEINAKKGDK